MLQFQGVLHISVNGHEAHLEAHGKVMRLDLDDPVSFLRASSLFYKRNLNLLRLLTEHLVRNELTLTIVSRDRTLVLMGQDAKSGLTGSLLDLQHIEIRVSTLLSRIAG